MMQQKIQDLQQKNIKQQNPSVYADPQYYHLKHLQNDLSVTKNSDINYQKDQQLNQSNNQTLDDLNQNSVYQLSQNLTSISNYPDQSQKIKNNILNNPQSKQEISQDHLSNQENQENQQNDQKNTNINNASNSKSNLWKQRHKEQERRKQYQTIVQQYPKHIPIIIEKHKDAKMKEFDKEKFCIQKNQEVSKIQFVLREKLKIRIQDAIFLFAHDGYMRNLKLLSINAKMQDIYSQYKQDDGFLYITYSEYQTFG